MKPNYEAVIGLEVHVQLKTKTKIFCSCPVGWGGEPNTRVCPVCLGLPGVLPVLNKKAVELAVRAGLALGSRISTFSKFDRKNYFYPDLPKAYQISQYDKPLNIGGKVEIRVGEEEKTIEITRAHLEEDAGKLTHFEKEGFSGVDYNRTGVPLLEIVSEPNMRTPQEAYEYLKALRSLIRYTGVSDCDMEKGSFRCDANISLRPVGTEALGVKTEVKNMNSFRGVERALSYEIERQRRLLEAGEKISQETRLYDADSQKTFSMRSKEEAHDYRYFPDPDLVPIIVDEKWVEEIRSTLPELPIHRADRFQSQYGLSEYDAGVLTAEKELADYFEEVLKYYNGKNYQRIANLITNEVLALYNSHDFPIDRYLTFFSAESFANLVIMLDSGKTNIKIAKDLIKSMFEIIRPTIEDRLRDLEELNEDVLNAIKKRNAKDTDPKRLIAKEGKEQISDTGEIDKIVAQVIIDNPGPIADFRGGKKQALSFLVGQVMKATRGQANPALVNQLLRDRLNPPA